MPRLSSAASASTPSELPPLRAYQADGIDWLRAGGVNKLLADEPGLGKSRQLIAAARGQTLVVAPTMVLDGGTWDDELTLWADDPSRFTQAGYAQLNERAWTGKLRADGEPNLSATAPTEKLRPEYRDRWDTVILDEAQYVKGRSSKWTKAVLKLDAERVYLATGTPIPNWADELFIPLQLIYPEKNYPGGPLGSYWRWAQEWFDCTPTRWSQGMPSVGELLGCVPACFDRPILDPCEHYHAFHEANLGDRFLQRLRDDVLTDLPPLTVQQVLTPMTTRQAKVYAELKRDFVSWASDHADELVAWNAAALNEMLTKVATGLEVLDPGATAGSGKFDRLAWDLLGRPADRATLVVAHHQEVLEAAKRVVVDPMGLRGAIVHGDTSKADRRSRIAAFKAGELDVLLGSLDTVAEGLTLTQADMCIFLQKSYKPSRNQQAMRRIHRLGQTRPVTILEYLTPKTVDFNKESELERKTDRQMRHFRAAEMARLV